MNTVNLKGKIVGDGHDAVFMAEVNSAFDTDLEEGQRMIKAASEAGSDFLKAEIIRSTDIVLNDGSEFTYKYGFDGKTKSEKWYDIVERKVNSLEFYREMFEYSRSLGLEFVVSVYDIESIAFLAEMEAAAIKIPSSNINHQPIIEAASKTGIPIIMDTGRIYMYEIARAINWVEKYGSSDVIINHHPGSGPAPADVHNLKIMDKYKRIFGVPVGLSCHYVGNEILYTAVGVGANVLEKPISFNPAKDDLDTVFAVDIRELKDVVRKVKNSSRAIGNDELRPYSVDRHIDQRMGVVASHDLSNEDIISTDNFTFAWPCKGVSVEEWSRIEGLSIGKAFKKGDPLLWNDIEFG